MGMTRPSRARARAILTGGAAAAILLLAACSGPAGTPASGPAAQGAPRIRTGAVPGGAASAPAPASAAPGGQVTLTRLAPPQSVIYTADLTIRSPDVAAAASAAAGIATAAGGYVAGEQENAAPGGRAAPRVALTLKVPVAAYQPALARLARLGRQVTFRERAADVTQEVADVGSRVATAQAAIRQLRALLTHAGSVGELLSVQDEINAEEAALESLLAQQRALARETSYATVSMLILGHRPRPARHPAKPRRGFLAGLAAGWRALVTAVAWLLTALGAALPFAVLLALLAGAGWAARRRLARRKASASATGPPAPAS